MDDELQVILVELEAKTKTIVELTALLSDKLGFLFQSALGTTPSCVVLPENFLFYSGDKERIYKFAYSQEYKEAVEALKEIARRYGIWLIAGTLPRAASNGKLYIESLCFDPNGKEIGSYKKNHLFKAYVGDKFYNEGQIFTPGSDQLIVEIAGFKIGVAVCFDLRFPNMFLKMRAKGADVFVVPAAFTKTTGYLAWEALLKARAIETQSYVLGCGLCGVGENDCETWGHSMIIEPDGSILRETDNSKLVVAKLSKKKLLTVRHNMPLTFDYV